MPNYLYSMEVLEPRCPNCGTVIDYGVNTKYDDKLKTHICLNCNKPL